MDSSTEDCRRWVELLWIPRRVVPVAFFLTFSLFIEEGVSSSSDLSPGCILANCSLLVRPRAQILEQVEGGELVVNKGKDDVPKVTPGGKERDLNPIEGFEAGYKLAEVSLPRIPLVRSVVRRVSTDRASCLAFHPSGQPPGAHQAARGNSPSSLSWFVLPLSLSSSRRRRPLACSDHSPSLPTFIFPSLAAGVPITVSPVFLRIQPILAPLPFSEPTLLLPTLASVASASDPSTPASNAIIATTASAAPQHLYFLLLLYDPSHSLRHSTITQAVPSQWMDIPYEENEWVEEALVDVIRKGVEVVGQDYVGRRMGILKGVEEGKGEEGGEKVAVAEGGEKKEQ